MYTVYIKGYEEQCQITIFNKTWISVAFNLFRISDYHIYFFFFWQKGKLVLRSLLSEGNYFLGDCYFWDL